MDSRIFGHTDSAMHDSEYPPTVRDALEEEMREIDDGDMEEFDTLLLDGSEKTIAILGDRWWPQAARQEGGKISQIQLCITWKKISERPTVKGVSIRSRDGTPSRKGCVVNGLITKGHF